MIGWTLAAALAAMAQAPLTETEMVRVADAFDQAQIAQDQAALARMVDEDLVFVDGSGKRQGKAEFIAGWTAAEDDYAPVTLVDRTFTPLGEDAFVASAETRLHGTSSGRPFAVRIRFSDTFRRDAEGWQAVHIHVTRIPD